MHIGAALSTFQEAFYGLIYGEGYLDSGNVFGSEFRSLCQGPSDRKKGDGRGGIPALFICQSGG